jgi:hypothetical protein
LSYRWPRGDPYLCGTQPALLGCMSGISWGAESPRDRKVPCIPISLALFSTLDHTEQSRDAVSPALEPDFESGPSSGPWIMPADPVHSTASISRSGEPFDRLHGSSGCSTRPGRSSRLPLCDSEHRAPRLEGLDSRHGRRAYLHCEPAIQVLHGGPNSPLRTP